MPCHEGTEQMPTMAAGHEGHGTSPDGLHDGKTSAPQTCDHSTSAGSCACDLLCVSGPAAMLTGPDSLHTPDQRAAEPAGYHSRGTAPGHTPDLLRPPSILIA